MKYKNRKGESIKYPRGSKFLKCFDGKHLAMKMSMRIRKLDWLWW